MVKWGSCVAKPKNKQIQQYNSRRLVLWFTELWDLNVVKRGFSSIYPKIDVIL
jgi:hypothetical protein